MSGASRIDGGRCKVRELRAALLGELGVEVNALIASLNRAFFACFPNQKLFCAQCRYYVFVNELGGKMRWAEEQFTRRKRPLSAQRTAAIVAKRVVYAIETKNVAASDERVW